MIHVITGPPCAGKSTYVREHAGADELRVDYDEIAQTIGASVSHGATGVIKAAAFAARDAMIEVALGRAQAESWIIHTTPSADKLERYQAAGAEFVELDPGMDVCLERARRDNRPQHSLDAIAEYYRAQKSGGKKMKFKEIKVKYNDEGNGSIEGYASTWIREPDSYGDIVKQGAFSKSLSERWGGGKGIPFLWSHQMDRLPAFIGTATADEDEKGLHFVANFDDTPEAQRVRELYKDGRLRKFSFAYDVLDAGEVTLEGGRKANELRELDIFEISAVLVPANDDAGLIGVKAGKRNSKADEDLIKEINGYIDNAFGALQAAQDRVRELLGQEDADEQRDGEDERKGKGAPEDQTVSNPDQKARLLAYINKIEKGE